MSRLRKTGQFSFFVLGASTCCVVVSAVLWINTRLNQPSPEQITFSVGYSLPECGTEEFTSPTQTCLQSGSDYISGFNSHIRSLLFPLVVLVCLILEEIKVFKVAQTDGSSTQANLFNLTRCWLDTVDATAAHERVRSRSASTVSWARRKSTMPMQSRLHRARVEAKAWFREARWWLEEKATQLSTFWARPNIVMATYYSRFVKPLWIRMTTTLRPHAARVHDLGFRSGCLRLLNVLYKLIPFLTEVGMVAINAVLLAQYANYLGIRNDRAWSLGQIISVTIWVPVVAEYIYLLFCGIEEGFEYKLSKPYHVTKRDDADSDEDSDAASGKSSSRSSIALQPLTQPAPVYSSVATSERKLSGATSMAPDDDELEVGEAQSPPTPRRTSQSPYLGT